MKNQTLQRTWLLAAGLILAANITQANDLRVTNVALVHTDKNNLTTDIKFDLSWSNSWRANWVEATTPEGDTVVTNWDAAWVFVKYRVLEGADTNWYHARLASGGHRAPSGTTIDVGTNGGGTNVGAFIYRSENGSGGLNLTGVRLRWDYTSNSLTLTNPIDVSVHGIEMVYIPEGRFSLGSGGTHEDGNHGSFTDGAWSSGTAFPFRVTSEDELEVTNDTGCLWGTWTNSTAGIGPPGALSNAFPKGYGAFYCMKYEVTQGQYTEYLNQLTETQAGNRYEVNTGTNRQTMGGSWPNYTNGAPDRAVGYLDWNDIKSYADWAGLRPMTELEFEKACRGPKTPVPNENAWNSITRRSQTNAFYGVDGSGTETAVPAGAYTYANCNYTSSGPMPGPVRVGIYATNSATRQTSGAGYYGVMEMSGNLYEFAVTAGALNQNPAHGRVFRGTHGDGTLTAAGAADVSSWPTIYLGFGCRGEYYDGTGASLHISDRYHGSYNQGNRQPYNGCRAVRTAP